MGNEAVLEAWQRRLDDGRRLAFEDVLPESPIFCRSQGLDFAKMPDGSLSYWKDLSMDMKLSLLDYALEKIKLKHQHCRFVVENSIQEEEVPACGN